MQNNLSNHSVKIRRALSLVFLLILYAGNAFAAGEEIPAVDHRFCLTYLLAPEEERIITEIERLEDLIGNSGALSGEQTAHVEYAAGVLHTYRYIRSARRDNAMRAKELLESAETQFAGEDLFTVHIGMAHAFVASIRTIFGVGDLKKMQSELQSIDRDHPDWLIRFLRGITSVEVGRALPNVFTIKEIRKEAVEVGSADLRYVLDLPRLPGTGPFDPRTYDFGSKPVPWQIADKARSVLEDG